MKECPHTFSFYEDGTLRCSLEAGHDGPHMPTRRLWLNLKEILGGIRVQRFDRDGHKEEK